jgi:hypothetical protein
MDELNQIKQVLETALLTSLEPLSPSQMGKLFEPALTATWCGMRGIAGGLDGRGVELCRSPPAGASSRGAKCSRSRPVVA